MASQPTGRFTVAATLQKPVQLSQTPYLVPHLVQKVLDDEAIQRGEFGDSRYPQLRTASASDGRWKGLPHQSGDGFWPLLQGQIHQPHPVPKAQLFPAHALTASLPLTDFSLRQIHGLLLLGLTKRSQGRFIFRGEKMTEGSKSR